MDGRCLFNFPDREPKFLTVVDASAKVKWVHAKVFVFTKLVYFVALCACSTFQSPFTHSQLAIGYTATACPIMCTCHVCVAITNIQHLQQSQCRVIWLELWCKHNNGKCQVEKFLLWQIMQQHINQRNNAGVNRCVEFNLKMIMQQEHNHHND